MDRVRSGGPARQGLDPTSPALLRLVAVDGDDVQRERLTSAVRRNGDLMVVGEGDSFVDALALTVLERPRVVLIGDQTDQFEYRRDIGLIHDISPDSRVCLYSDGPMISDDADLVLDKSLPIERVVAHLVLLSG